MVNKSSASSLPIGQWMRGSWAVGLRNMPNTPRIKFAKPLCSLRKLGVASELMAIIGVVFPVSIYETDLGY